MATEEAEVATLNGALTPWSVATGRLPAQLHDAALVDHTGARISEVVTPYARAWACVDVHQGLCAIDKGPGLAAVS